MLPKYFEEASLITRKAEQSRNGAWNTYLDTEFKVSYSDDKLLPRR